MPTATSCRSTFIAGAAAAALLAGCGQKDLAPQGPAPGSAASSGVPYPPAGTTPASSPVAPISQIAPRQAEARPTLRIKPWPTLTPLPPLEGGDQLGLRRLDRFGGGIAGIAVQGDYAYLLVGSRLEVLDARDPRRLVRLGSTPALSREPSWLGEVVAQGGVVAVATGDGVLFVDARDPSAPREAGWVPLEAMGGHIVGDGTTFATLMTLEQGRSYGIQLIDATDPHHPRLGGLIDIFGYAPAMWLENETLWSLSRVSEDFDQNRRNGEMARGTGLRRINVSDPHRPVEIPIDDLRPKQANDVFPALAVRGENLYVLEEFDETDDKRLNVLRVVGYQEDRPELELRGEWSGKHFDEVWESWYAYFAGERLVIVPNSGRLDDEIAQVFDVADPRAPRLLSDLNAALAQPGCDAVSAPAVSGNLLWLPCKNGLRVLDMAGSAPERLVGTYHPTNGPALRSSANAWAGDVLWTVDDAPPASASGKASPPVIAAWNLAGPGEPVLLGSFPANMQVDALATDGSFLYLAGNEWGDVRVVDVRDPDHPAEVAMLERSTERETCMYGTSNQPCPMQGVRSAAVVHGKLAISYSEGNGDGLIEVIDVRDPARPVVEGWTLPGYRMEVSNLQSTGDVVWATLRDAVSSSYVVAVDLSRFRSGSEGLAVPATDGAFGSCLATVGERAFTAQLLPKLKSAPASAGREQPRVTLRALGQATDGSIQVAGAITMTLPVFVDNDQSAGCSLVGDDGLAVLGVWNGGPDDPPVYYIIDIADPANMVIRGRHRGAGLPDPFALRGRTLYELSTSGLSRWAVEPY